MGIATYKDMCIDAVDSAVLGRFWAPALGLELELEERGGPDALLRGSDSTRHVWLNAVPELKTAKQRVHIDVHAGSVDELIALGATMLEPADEYGRPWSVLADPEGGEFCAFVREPADLPDYRMHELVIDCVDPLATCTWWASVFGCAMDGKADNDWWWLTDVPGLPYGGWDFVPVPEPKTVKNRIHWDVLVDSPDTIDELGAAGATVLRAQDHELAWTVMADPEGNEFCAFVRS